MARVLIAIIAFFWMFFAHAEPPSMPLPASDAFKLSVEYNQPGLLVLHWEMPKGYYLYKNRIHISVSPSSSVRIGSLRWPEGVLQHENEPIYTGHLIMPVSFVLQNDSMLDVFISYQGCSDRGFCYPPIHRLLAVDLANLLPPKDITHQLIVVTKAPHKTQTQTQTLSTQAKVERIFADRSFIFIMFSFLGLGILLAFTPCVLPMIPILSSIIVGHGKKMSVQKTFLLSLAYVLGMAMTYAVAGVFVALVGSSIQTELQRPWVIALFSGFFVLLALSLFGLYQLQMPASWQRRIIAFSNRQKGGSYFSVFLMGSLSSLIVSPCVSPPLIGVLSFIADSGNLWLGGFALLALGLGMGLPLLLVGLSAGHILPKAGAWMGVIEKLMGLTMLAFAIWILSRIIPGYVTLFLWSVLMIVVSVFLGLLTTAKNDTERLCRGFALVLLIYGIILMVGAALRNSDPFYPWQGLRVLKDKTEQAREYQPISFIVPRNMDEFDAILLKARMNKKIVLLDFYADWCESCVNMDKMVFTQMDVKNALQDIVVVRADVTKNNAFNAAMLKRFQVIAPPMILFFNRDGDELLKDRLVGRISADELIAQTKKIQGY